MFEKFFFNKEIKTALKAVENNPDNILMLNILGNLYVKYKLFDKAIEIFEKILRLDEKFLPAQNALANCYIYNKQPLKAFKTLKFLYIANSQDETIKNRILSLIDVKCPIEMKIDIQKGVSELFDDNNEIKEKLAKSYLKNGEFSKAVNIYELLIGREEKNEYLIALSKIYIEIKNYVKASAILEKLMLKGEFNLKYAKILADLYTKTNRIEEAKGLYELLVENNPDERKFFREKLAELYLQKSQYNKTLEVAQDIIQEDKYDKKSKFLQIKALEEQEKYSEAICLLKEFYSDPIDTDTEKKIENMIVRISISYSEKLRLQKKYTEAIDTLLIALRYDETNKNIYYELAKISTDIKDFSGAKEYIKLAESFRNG